MSHSLKKREMSEVKTHIILTEFAFARSFSETASCLASALYAKFAN